MADQLEEINGVIEMAYLKSEGVCWHGKGQALHDGATQQEWLEATNMGNWKISEAPVLFYDDETESVLANPRSKVLFRSDTKTPLSTVGSGYRVVQPDEVIEFFTDVIESMGYEMCTAGVLFGGKKFWAQANTGNQTTLRGKDTVQSKLLLSTACDGSLATTAAYTTTRVVCNNTLQMALNGNLDRIKVPHSRKFNAEEVKNQLGLVNDSFKEWAGIAEAMTDRRMADTQVIDYFAQVFDIYETDEKKESLEDRVQYAVQSKIVMNCLELFQGAGQGATLDTASGTLWGALNAVTEYADHRRNTRTLDSRMDSAWFGSYNNFKNRAWDEAMLLVA